VDTYAKILECSELRAGQYRVHFGPFSDTKDPISPGRTIEMESDLFELSRSYPGECRHYKQPIVVKSAEAQVDAAEVGVVSQVNGMLWGGYM
jgi:hypothetical protein